MTPRRFSTKVVTALAAVALVTAGCGSDDSDSGSGDTASGSDTVRLAINNTSSSLTAVVAEEQGFFEKHGVDAELTVVNDISKVPPALGQQFDIGFGVQPSLIRAASQGVDIVMVSGNSQTTDEKPDYVVMAKPDAGISGPEDLAGKRLGAPTLAGNVHQATLYWLSEEGVDLAGVTSVQTPNASMMDQLDAGLIDAAEMQQPFVQVAEDAGLVVVGNSLSAVGDPAYMSSWQAQRSWAEENQETIANFKAALDEAIEWMAANEEETVQILAEHTGLDAALLEGSPMPTFSTDSPLEAVEQWDAVLRGVGDFDADVDYDGLIVTSD